jgi:hypothetical protein
MPDRESEQTKVTVTFDVYMPDPFAGGEVVSVMVGGVLSMLSVTPSAAVFPALSVAVPETTWFAPSVVTVCGGGPVATPDSASAQTNVTVTFVLFHPAALGGGTMDAAMVGGVVSVSKVCEITVLELPERSKTVS